MLVSPGDVEDERNAVNEIIGMLQKRAARRGATFQLSKWEDIRPGYSPAGVQTRIEEELSIPDCDVLVAVFRSNGLSACVTRYDSPRDEDP